MRAPTIPPKKCSTVKVDGCEEGNTDRDKQQNRPRQATKEMNIGENLVLGVGRIEVTQAGDTVEVYGTGDVIGLEGGMGNCERPRPRPPFY